MQDYKETLKEAVIGLHEATDTELNDINSYLLELLALLIQERAKREKRE